MTRPSKTTLPLLAVLSIVLCAQALFAKSNDKQWVGTWASAPLLDAHAKTAEDMFALGGQGATLREVVHVSMGGEMVRVRFSNLYGAGPLVIAAAEIAQSAKGAAIAPGSGKALTFRFHTTRRPGGQRCCPLQVRPPFRLDRQLLSPQPVGPHY